MMDKVAGLIAVWGDPEGYVQQLAFQDEMDKIATNRNAAAGAIVGALLGGSAGYGANVPRGKKGKSLNEAVLGLVPSSRYKKESGRVKSWKKHPGLAALRGAGGGALLGAVLGSVKK